MQERSWDISSSINGDDSNVGIKLVVKIKGQGIVETLDSEIFASLDEYLEIHPNTPQKMPQVIWVKANLLNYSWRQKSADSIVYSNIDEDAADDVDSGMS